MEAGSTSFGARPLIADTSVWAKLGKRTPDDVATAFRAAVTAGRILGSPIVRLEYLHHLTTAEFERFDESYSGLPRQVPVTREACSVAVRAVRALRAKNKGGYHRVSLGDVLIAASAHVAGVDVLHDDTDFDRLAEVLAFGSVRFLPFGEKRP